MQWCMVPWLCSGTRAVILVRGRGLCGSVLVCAGGSVMRQGRWWRRLLQGGCEVLSNTLNGSLIAGEEGNVVITVEFAKG